MNLFDIIEVKERDWAHHLPLMAKNLKGPEERYGAIQLAGARLWLAQEDGKNFAGMVAVSQQWRVGDSILPVTGMCHGFCDREYRNRGVYSSIVQHSLDACCDSGSLFSWGISDKRLYLPLGFSPVPRSGLMLPVHAADEHLEIVMNPLSVRLDAWVQWGAKDESGVVNRTTPYWRYLKQAVKYKPLTVLELDQGEEENCFLIVEAWRDSLWIAEAYISNSAPELATKAVDVALQYARNCGLSYVRTVMPSVCAFTGALRRAGAQQEVSENLLVNMMDFERVTVSVSKELERRLIQCRQKPESCTVEVYGHGTWQFCFNGKMLRILPAVDATFGITSGDFVALLLGELPEKVCAASSELLTNLACTPIQTMWGTDRL